MTVVSTAEWMVGMTVVGLGLSSADLKVVLMAVSLVDPWADRMNNMSAEMMVD